MRFECINYLWKYQLSCHSAGNKYPKPPRDLEFGPMHHDSHSSGQLLSTIISWTPPARTQSIPVDKYKIFWSRQLPGSSVAMQHATVAEPHRYFELRHLQPESTYHVQVQAISVFGQKRLRSKKSSITLNTTSVSEAIAATTPLAAMSHVRHLASQHSVVRLRFILSKGNELVVKVHWPHDANYS